MRSELCPSSCLKNKFNFLLLLIKIYLKSVRKNKFSPEHINFDGKNNEYEYDELIQKHIENLTRLRKQDGNAYKSKEAHWHCIRK